MNKVLIAYWSGTGNTEAMANAVAKGVQNAGGEAVLKAVSETSPAEVSEYSSIAFGCPSMGAEVLEESEMEPYIEEVEGLISGKNVGLFGSYGWGDGEWMRDWYERMSNAGASLVEDEGIICNDAPDDDAEAACEALGATLAKA